MQLPSFFLIISCLVLFFGVLLASSPLLIQAQDSTTTSAPTTTTIVSPLNYKFVADIEATYTDPSNSNLIKSSSARIFGDPTMGDAWTCVILTSNRTEIAMAMNLASDLARVTVCGQAARNIPYSQLDSEFQVLARVCSVMKWPETWSSPLTKQQLAGVPVYTGESTCYPTPSETCACTCRYAFDDPEWVGEARQALRAEEITSCPSTCNFPTNTFVSVMSMMKVSMAPELIIGNCDNANEGGVSSSSVSWNTNNNQNSDGTSITYNFGAPTDFPALPQTFAANFKVTLLEYGVNIEFMTIYNAFAKAARTTVFSVDEVDGSIEFASGETYLTLGLSEMTYRIQHETIHGDANSDYSYSDNCEKMVFSEDIFASSVHRLLMVPSTAPPVFVGRYTVRGMPCDLWSQAVAANLKVDWYFPLATTTRIAGNSEQTSERLPRRIVLRGTGRSPFFANHPFIPQTMQPGVEDTTYCDRKPFFYDPHCSGDEVSDSLSYQHVIDIAELPTFLSQNTTLLFTPPSVCSGASVVSTTCTQNGVNGAIVFLLAMVCLGIGVLSGRNFCPAKNNDDINEKKNNNEEDFEGASTQHSNARFGNNNTNNTHGNSSAYSPAAANDEGRQEVVIGAGDDTPARPLQ